jgi:predicted metal-dependent hydrolase
MGIEAIRAFAISKLGWIRKQQEKLLTQERETPREFIDRESHYVWGRRYLLEVIEGDEVPSVELKGRKIRLHIRPHHGEEKRREIMQAWYRGLLRTETTDLIEKWEPLIGVNVEKINIQSMKTMWGGCNPVKKSIRLNTELAKKPRECLEYIVIHEMVHLLEPTHNARFISLMDRFQSNWRHRQDLLNQLPVRHEAWRY